ncbi:MAG: mechanosensitive ion channel family protein [Nitrospira sp.]|uniref:Small-conductance mechanosensitive channel n=1 Tax=Candidatus Nitrospira inopinata TaxID=1715989 RepID=A0A0S4KR49_9BACT|nr:mechanosensitive ion channel family protein [Candidatus Nitrospira inopinata]MCP9452356.1 mechanosensitive ion channel family protein [Nitrospira sp.]MCP9464560.1 mechanosensitive ion channel family protein [Nitrospira sp.]CUQ65672.1 Small-conductance mechanosensitive channel [Candidatus Nitrospira inopinata]
MTQEAWVAQLIERSIQWGMSSGIRAVLICLGMLFLLAVIRQALARVRRLLEGALPTPAQRQRAETLTQVLRDVARVFVVAVGTMMVLSEIGIDLKPLLAAAGLGGLAIGFGAQSLVKDVISGFFILLEDSIAVGDVVEIAGVSGLVEEVKLRSIRLRDVSGSVHVVPNGIVDRVKNMTKGFSFYVFDVGVAYKEDVDRVMAVLVEIAEELRADPLYAEDILEPLEMLGVDRFDDSAVIIRCRIKTMPSKQWRVGREMNRRIKKTFDAKGIEIPFPHRTLYWGEGQAPPAIVRTGA